ncbi:MAG: methyltransferase domain-containing protein [Aphanocapsa feldmannii 277cV]|uniref:Methyltransferase domain-containing protein n=1 Tax=Aphanocapsa feldmannii 277cV TaxID=2507553 RepID=A0A524RPP2_9CHRO|nr:MAG: methyltransferase domain-containing protein [Aphanocapsa feldmannii 277cV]
MIRPRPAAAAAAPPAGPATAGVQRQAPLPSGARVRLAFEAAAQRYHRGALLQRAMAWRLALLQRDVPLPAGPRLDLGGGSGSLAQALDAWGIPGLTVVDQVDELLDLAAPRPTRRWDLRRGLPPLARAPALVASNFALQWLPRPEHHLRHWCDALAPGGSLLLALPVAGSFPQWHQAAAAAGVPCTAMAFPAAERLVKTAGQVLLLRRLERRRFTRHWSSPLAFLQALRDLGLAASGHPALGPGQLRALQRHWPAAARGGVAISWQVLLLQGRRRPAPASGQGP